MPGFAASVTPKLVQVSTTWVSVKFPLVVFYTTKKFLGPVGTFTTCPGY